MKQPKHVARKKPARRLTRNASARVLVLEHFSLQRVKEEARAARKVGE